MLADHCIIGDSKLCLQLSVMQFSNQHEQNLIPEKKADQKTLEWNYDFEFSVRSRESASTLFALFFRQTPWQYLKLGHYRLPSLISSFTIHSSSKIQIYTPHRSIIYATTLNSPLIKQFNQWYHYKDIGDYLQIPTNSKLFWKFAGNQWISVQMFQIILFIQHK
jgi:hypothetical protein